MDEGWSRTDPITGKTYFHSSNGDDLGYSKIEPITGHTHFYSSDGDDVGYSKIEPITGHTHYYTSSAYLNVAAGGGPIGPVSEDLSGLGMWWRNHAWSSSVSVAGVMFIPMLVVTVMNRGSALFDWWGWWLLIAGPLMATTLWNVIVTIIILVRARSGARKYALYRRFAIWSSIAWLSGVGVLWLLARGGGS